MWLKKVKKADKIDCILLTAFYVTFLFYKVFLRFAAKLGLVISQKPRVFLMIYLQIHKQQKLFISLLQLIQNSF